MVMISYTTNPVNIDNLVPEKYALPIKYMLEVIGSHRYRHNVRQAYVDGVQPFKDLGIAIPPSLRNIEVALGWASKALDSVAQRSVFDGVSIPSKNGDDFGIDDIVEENLLHMENSKVIYSTLVQASTFQAVFRGDTSAGEPEVVIQAFEATEATGIYNSVTKKLAAALTIVNEDQGRIDRFLAYFSDVILDFRYDKTYTTWDVEAYQNSLGVVPVVPITYGSTLARPFGKSYLSREMMNLIDAAMRTVARNEIGAEFFVTPQRYMLGADPEQFTDENGNTVPAWDLTMGRLLGIGYNDKEDVMPEVGTFDSMSPSAGIALLESYASQFAAAAKVPISALGVEHANPVSAEGVHAVREDLFKAVEDANRGFGIGYKRLLQMGAALKNDLDINNLPDELKKLTINWRNPATPSVAAAADATMKLVAAGILPADSEVTMRRAGLTEAEIQSLISHRDRYGAIDKLASLVGNQSSSYQSVNRLAQNSPVEE